MNVTLNQSKLQSQIEQAAEMLRQEGAREIYVFGSTASSSQRSNSDVDLAVAGLPPAKFFRALAAISNLFDCPVDLVDLDEANPFTTHLKRRGELVRVG
jgi:predicted nucleotidyltransferase